MQPGGYGIGSGVTVGRSARMVASDYPGKRPWRFTGGTIKFVAVDVSGEPYVDLEHAAIAMLARE
jgi:arylsulfatase